jgi:basic membrane lipoprotein Med (substrate-binding protein (PBP1-ABC) superfamily)/DNA-binding SARP family transcriptional activator
MEYRILGPFEVLNDGRPVEIGARQQRALLTLLLLNLNSVVSTERILEQIWPTDPTGKERTLWVYISKLRAALEPGRQAHSRSSVLVTKDHGYMLRADRSDLDTHRFEELAARGNALLVDDPEQAADVLRQALALWRGTALEDFEYDEFAQAATARLEELRLVAIEDRIEADTRSRRHRDVLGELEQLVRDHPYRERLVGLQMVALYGAGRQADALRAFERYRLMILEELGLEPSPELRRIEEQVLLHDERLVRDPGPEALEGQLRTPNPFKGLHAFGESDVATFFGRERLVADVVRRVASGARLVTLVGASGSGKSSVLHAGLVPAIRKGAIDGSPEWLIAKMVPGARPFREVEAALMRSRLDAPDGLSELLDDPEDGLLRACLRLLPDRDARVLIVIDQFEELFTLGARADEVARFIRNLEVVLNDPYGRVLLVVGLRADFYGRPLEYPRFAQLLGDSVVNVVSLLPDELETAAEEPAAAAGAQLEPALVVQLLSDVAGQAGALPQFQYALTELFERRDGTLLTVDAYRAMGGVSGALAQRAEELFLRLDADQRFAAKQLLLRLVTVSDQGALSRRRVPAAEIVAIATDVVALQAALDGLSRNRLVTFDRDPVSGSPTVEVAHEALLDRWPRLHEWIEDGRRDVRRHGLLVTALVEWRDSGESPDYLLSGQRLADYESWVTTSTLLLSSDEERYLDASIGHREAESRAEDERVARERRLDRRARRRLWALIPGSVAIVMILGGVGFVLLRGGDPSIVVVHGVEGDLGITDMMIAGVGSSERERDIAVDLHEPLVDPEADLRSLADSGTDLIVVGSEFDAIVERVAPDHPDVHWVAIDPVALHIERTNISEVHFAVEDSAFLAGAAAALSTQTGKVGFIGGQQSFRTESSRNGFEQGVFWEDADIEVMSVFLGSVANPLAELETRDDLAYELATTMYAEGVDVIFHDAGEAGTGVIGAAREFSGSERHVWTIGADADEYLTASAADRRYVLSSTIKRFDTAVEGAIASFLDGTLEPGDTVLGLSADGVGLSRSGDYLSGIEGRLANLEAEIAFGHLPVSPFAAREAGWQATPDVTVELALGDDACEIVRVSGATIDGEELRVQRGMTIQFRVTNESGGVGGVAVRTVGSGVTLADLRAEAELGIPSSFGELHAITLVELGATTSAAALVTGTRLVPNCLHYEVETRPSNFPALIVRPTA